MEREKSTQPRHCLPRSGAPNSTPSLGCCRVMWRCNCGAILPAVQYQRRSCRRRLLFTNPHTYVVFEWPNEASVTFGACHFIGSTTSSCDMR